MKSLTSELNVAHRQVNLYEVEKSKLKDENKIYAKWKQTTEKTIKQLRKIQREKNMQLQRYKSQLSKTMGALKQKTAALVNLKKSNEKKRNFVEKQEIMEINKLKIRLENY